MKHFIQILLTCSLISTTIAPAAMAQKRGKTAEQKLLTEKWTLSAVNTDPVKGADVRMSFDAKSGQVYVQACNSFQGNYYLENKQGEISFDRMRGTLKWCPDDNIQQLERKLVNSVFNEKICTYSVLGNFLTLVDHQGTSYTWINDAQASLQKYLESNSWKLIELDGFTGVYDQTIEFDFKENKIWGHAGCNNYFASFTIGNDVIYPGPIGTTRRACVDPVQNKDEAKFLEILNSGPLFFDVADQTLNFYKDGRIVLMFARNGKPKIYEH